MARSQIQYGSQGDDVKELQKSLNKNGYNLSVDGIFGANTQKAVRDYQKKNKLAVDGIVGTNTWNVLLQNSDSSTTTTAPEEDDNSYPSFEYKPSENAQAATDALDTHLGQKPGEYTSKWQDQIDDVINKILNREKFSYDLNGDALYQQYKDKYIQQGKMAMGDAIGQASAMTGGYGNSYAQSVGQQQYQASLENLNDIVPELYQMAYDKYNQEGQDLYNQYSLLGTQEEQDYGRYRDTVSDWNTDRGYLADRADSERSFDYGTQYDNWTSGYNVHRDAIEDALAKETLEYQKERDKISDEQWQKQFDAVYGSTGSSGSAVSGGSSGGSLIGKTPTKTTTMTNLSGVAGDGNGSYSGKSAGYDNVKAKAASFTDNDALNAYLTSQFNAGVITEEEMGELYLAHETPSLQNRNWSAGKDGGVNWLWGIDNNATVKDQYGNEYRLDKLVDALVAEGMSKSEAKDYVKKLQSTLGL